LRCGAVLGALLALTCLNRPLPAQEVYKSVDADGHVVYSDRGNSKSAPKTAVHVEEPDAAEAARLAREQERLKAADTQRTRQQAIDDKTKAAEDHRRQSACQNARNNYYRLVDPGRLFHRDADGNRIFYTDDEIAAMRDEAKRAMTGACGG
jgi:Domain of unknown function (DUF4124)